MISFVKTRAQSNYAGAEQLGKLCTSCRIVIPSVPRSPGFCSFSEVLPGFLTYLERASQTRLLASPTAALAADSVQNDNNDLCRASLAARYNGEATEGEKS